MAQQNQETIHVDSGSFPARRKRGRPRKYDDSACEPRRRYLHSSSAFMQGGSSQGHQTIPMQHNPTAVLGLGSHALPIQMNPTNSNVPNSAQTEANQTSGIDSGCHAVPSPGNLFTCSLKVPQAKQPVSPNQSQNSLIGQAVCGVLEGTFDAGYLLTVRVGSTGDVLKGLVFNPCSTVPISEKNDIAPLLPAVHFGASLSLAEAPRTEPTSVSVHSAVTAVSCKGPDAPNKSINPETETSVNVSELTKIATCDDKQADHDACQISQTEAQAETFPDQSLAVKNHDACQISPTEVQAETFPDQILAVRNIDDKSEASVVNQESGIPASPSATKMESIEEPMPKQTENIFVMVGVDCSLEQTIKSSAVESAGGSDLQHIGKQTENMIKELEDSEHNLVEEKSSDVLLSMQTPDEHALLLPDEPKSGFGEQTLSMSALPHDLFNA